MTISERIFELLATIPGKNAAGMGRLIGVGTNQTTSWKQRNADPPAKYIAQISEYLGVSVTYLLTGEETQNDAAVVNRLSDDESTLLERYRALDTEGKEVVRVTALQEHRRVLSDRGTGEAHVG